VSLGAFFFWVAPTTWRGTTIRPAAAAADVPRNSRRESGVLLLFMVTFLSI
jgi:hypothetical protein